MASKKSFDLKKLETQALDSYDRWKSEDCTETRTDLFYKVRDLAHAILSVGDWEKYNIDIEETAYDYAIYLFERILTGFRLEPKENGTRFPLQHYMNLNIRHVIITLGDDELFKSLVEDMEYLLDTTESSEIEEEIQLENQFELKDLKLTLYKSLRVFYSEEEIRRLLPISLEFISEVSRKNIPNTAPDDVADFSLVLIALAKRVIKDNNVTYPYNGSKTELRQILNSSVRSSVFLASVVNTDFFPKELLLSVDTDSLSRIVSLMGGKTVRIPTQRELDTLLGTVITLSKNIIEGKTTKKALAESKSDFDLVFCNQINIQNFVSKSMESYKYFGKDQETKPLIHALLSSIKSIESMIDDLVKENKENISEEEIETYSELSKKFSHFAESLDSMIKPKKDWRNYEDLYS